MIDETGFLKKGDKSAGAQRPYSGTAGRIDNCQIGVFLAYAGRRGVAFLDRALCLPAAWCADRARCREADIPDDVPFRTKPELARVMLERALDARVPARWVTGDEVYGNDRRLRRWLEARRQPFVLAIKATEGFWRGGAAGLRHEPAAAIGAALPAQAWRVRSAGAGAKGPRRYRWAWVPLTRLETAAWRHGLLIRQSLSEPADRAYYVVCAPVGTALAEVVRVAGTRWGIEQGFEAAKQEVGLDQYEVRRWDAWYRYVTLALFVHAFLSVVRAQADGRERGAAHAGCCRSRYPRCAGW